MAFYHDPRLQTNLQYHYLPTVELQQQRKQVREAVWVAQRGGVVRFGWADGDAGERAGGLIVYPHRSLAHHHSCN